MLCQSFQGPDATNENSPDWPTHTFTISRADLGDGEGSLRGGGGDSVEPKISHVNFSTCSLFGLFYTSLNKDKRWAPCSLAGEWVTRGFPIFCI